MHTALKVHSMTGEILLKKSRTLRRDFLIMNMNYLM